MAEDLLAGLLVEEEKEEQRPAKPATPEERVARMAESKTTGAGDQALDELLAGFEQPSSQVKEETKPTTTETTTDLTKDLMNLATPQQQQTTVQSGKLSQGLPVEEEARPSLPSLPSQVEEAVEELAVEEEEPPNKLVILIVGEKGTGKTVTALSFPGEVCVLSFDRKAMPVKQFFYRGDKRIHVYDIVKWVDWRPERITQTAAKAFDVMEAVFKKCRAMNVDWIVIDGTEILEQLAEMYMRYRHGLGPIEGIRNLNIWKERKWILRDVHNKALTAARRGVIYTVYPTWSERIIAGEVVDRRQEPKWLEVIMFETDVVLWTRYDDSMKRFIVEVQSSKLDNLFPTGHVFDVTGKPLGKQVKWNEVFPDLGGQ